MPSVSVLREHSHFQNLFFLSIFNCQPSVSFANIASVFQHAFFFCLTSLLAPFLLLFYYKAPHHALNPPNTNTSTTEHCREKASRQTLRMKRGSQSTLRDFGFKKAKRSNETTPAVPSLVDTQQHSIDLTMDENSNSTITASEDTGPTTPATSAPPATPTAPATPATPNTVHSTAAQRHKAHGRPQAPATASPLPITDMSYGHQRPAAGYGSQKPFYRYACRHYRTGQCRKGRDCNFEHSVSAGLGPRGYLILANHIRELWVPHVLTTLSALQVHCNNDAMCHSITQLAKLTGCDDFTDDGTSAAGSLQNLHNFYSDNGPLPVPERERFFGTVLPWMIDCVKKTDELLGGPVDFMAAKADSGVKEVVMTEYQALVLLCHSFFCLVPFRHKRNRLMDYWKTNTDRDYYEHVTRHMPNCNFTSVFIGDCVWGVEGMSGYQFSSSSLGEESKTLSLAEEKLLCLHRYFMLEHAKGHADRNPAEIPVLVTTRSSLAPMDLPTWKQSSAPLATVVTVPQGHNIEDATGCLQLDFANAMIGGGVIGRGCVQEEIRFLVCPQLLVTRFFCERMGPREAIKMFGFRQVCKYRGYNDTFKYNGPHSDETRIVQHKGQNIADVSITAADAVNYQSRGRHPSEQYKTEEMKREMNKFFVAVRPIARDPFRPAEVATGKWGCGVFAGDSELKALLQLLATSEARIAQMRFYVFDDNTLAANLTAISAKLAAKGCRVGDVYKALLSYSAKMGTPFQHIERVLRLPQA